MLPVRKTSHTSEPMILAQQLNDISEGATALQRKIYLSFLAKQRKVEPEGEELNWPRLAQQKQHPSTKKDVILLETTKTTPINY